ncbi:MAG: lysylphosphatidylglycerol synthase transmembrane domain-containing protein [Anaerolineae bacterium]
MLLFIALLLAVWTLAPQALDLPLLVNRFRHVAVFPLSLALILQAPRYLGTGFLMALCTRSLAVPAPRLLASEVALASGAASKVLPIGGAGGVAVRFAFLRRCGLDQAAVGAYFVLQNMLGTAILALLFLASLAYEGLAGRRHITSAQAILPALAGLLLFAISLAWLLRHPAQVLRLAARLGKVCDSTTARLFRHTLRCQERFPAAMASLWQAFTLGESSKFWLLEGAFYSSWTIIGDIASLHLAGIALGIGVNVAITIFAYAASSFAASAVAMPAGLGVTEGTMAAVYASFGQPLDLAVSSVLLFRTISFWLPIVLGIIAGWHLRRRGAL